MFFKKMYFGTSLCFNSFRGALTSKPYAFLARPWEFKSVDSIDVFDALGSNIRVDVRGNRLLRILPRANDTINEDWISDRIRFVCDAIRLQRLDTPLLSLEGTHVPLNWYQSLIFFRFAYSSLSDKISFNSNKLKLHNYSYNFNVGSRLDKKSLLVAPVLDFAGNFLDLESSFIWSKLKSTFLPNVFSCDSIKQASVFAMRKNFFLDGGLANFDSYSSIVLVGFNFKILAPLLAIRFRGLIKQGIKIYNFGCVSGVAGVADIGSIHDFFKLLKAQHWLSNCLSRSKVTFIFGDLNCLKAFVGSFFTYNIRFNFGYFAQSSSFLNALEASVAVSNFSDELQNVNISPALQVYHTNGLSSEIAKDGFFTNDYNLKVLAASHGGVLASKADLILPVSTFFEQSKTYLNVVGVKQKAHLVLAAPNGVLDYSESLLLIYASFFLNGVNNKSLYVFFLQSAQIFLLNLNNIWVYVNKFFDLFETSGVVSCSLMIRSLFLPDPYINVPLQKNSVWLNGVDNLRFHKSISKFVNKSSLSKNFTNSDFYLQDEISLVSTTLVTASKRLNCKETFL